MSRIGVTALICLSAGLFGITACSETTNSSTYPTDSSDGADPTQPAARSYTYEIVRSFPHDTGAFTQGLAIEGETLYESTGNYGQSSLRQVALRTGEVERIRRLSSTIFGEGLALFDDKIIQLTWKSGVGFIYDRENFELLRSVAYPGEGWGITYDGSRFIVSDGSSILYFRDRVTFEETGRVAVRDEAGPVNNLNELEYVKGEVYANIWQEDRIARIDPESGRVTGWIDLEGLLESDGGDGPAGRVESSMRTGEAGSAGPAMRTGSAGRAGAADVLNGIAYDAAGDRLFVTGKWWPRLFEIRLVEKQDPSG